MGPAKFVSARALTLLASAGHLGLGGEAVAGIVGHEELAQAQLAQRGDGASHPHGSGVGSDRLTGPAVREDGRRVEQHACGVGIGQRCRSRYARFRCA